MVIPCQLYVGSGGVNTRGQRESIYVIHGLLLTTCPQLYKVEPDLDRKQ